MKLGEEYNLLAPEQYGSQKHKATITQCPSNKWLFYDNQQPVALCSNDAESCYNQIVLIIAALSLCRLGTPHSAVRSMIQTLAHLEHHICMAYGDSTCSQGLKQWKEGVARIRQGNGTGPHIWAAVSRPLFNIMWQDGFVTQFICTLSKQHWALAGLAFVDDTNLIMNDPSNTTQAVMEKCKIH